MAAEDNRIEVSEAEVTRPPHFSNEALKEHLQGVPVHPNHEILNLTNLALPNETMEAFQHALEQGQLGGLEVVGHRTGTGGYPEIEVRDPKTGQRVWLSSNTEVSRTGENRIATPPSIPIGTDEGAVTRDNPLPVELMKIAPEAQLQLLQMLALAQSPQQLHRLIIEMAHDQPDLESMGREAVLDLMEKRIKENMYLDAQNNLRLRPIAPQMVPPSERQVGRSPYYKFSMAARMEEWLTEGEDVVTRNVDSVIAAAEAYPDKPIQAQLLQELLGALPVVLDGHENLREKLGTKIEARYKIHELNLLTKYADGDQIEDKSNSLYPHEMESLKRTEGVWLALDILQERAGDYYRGKGPKIWDRQWQLIATNPDTATAFNLGGFSRDLAQIRALFDECRRNGLLSPAGLSGPSLDTADDYIKTALRMMAEARTKDERGVGPQTMADSLLPIPYLRDSEGKIIPDGNGDPILVGAEIKSVSDVDELPREDLLRIGAPLGTEDVEEIRRILKTNLAARNLNQNLRTLLTKTRIAFDIAEKIHVFTDEGVEAAGPELDHKKISREKLLELVEDFKERTGIELDTSDNDPAQWDLPFIQLVMKNVWLNVPDYLTGRDQTYEIEVMENGQKVKKKRTTFIPKGKRIDLLQFYYGKNGQPPSAEDEQIMDALVAAEAVKGRNSNLFANAWTAAKSETLIKHWDMIDPLKGLGTDPAGRETSVEHWHAVRQMREGTRWVAKMGLAQYSDTAAVSLRQAAGKFKNLKDIVDGDNWGSIYNAAVRPWGKRKGINRKAHDAYSEKEPYMFNSFESVFGKPVEAMHKMKFEILGPDLQEATEIERIMETIADGVLYAQKHLFDKTGGNFRSPGAIDMSYFIGHLVGKGIIEAETADRLIKKHLGGKYWNFVVLLGQSVGWGEGLMEALKKFIEGVGK